MKTTDANHSPRGIFSLETLPRMNPQQFLSISHWLALGHIPVTVKSFDPGGVIAHLTWALRARRKAE